MITSVGGSASATASFTVVVKAPSPPVPPPFSGPTLSFGASDDPLRTGLVRPFARTEHQDFATDSGVRLVLSCVGQGPFVYGWPLRGVLPALRARRSRLAFSPGFGRLSLVRRRDRAGEALERGSELHAGRARRGGSVLVLRPRPTVQPDHRRSYRGGDGGDAALNAARSAGAGSGSRMHHCRSRRRTA